MTADPWNAGHFWIYFSLFSTLIPTALHAVIACLSLVTVRLPGLRRYVLSGLDARIDDGPGTVMDLAALLTLRWVIAVGAVTVGGVLVLKVWGLGDDFLTLLLWWQATVAGWLT